MSAQAHAIEEFIAALYRADAVLDEDGVAHSISARSLTAERGNFLSILCEREGARSVLEIGMAWGLSTLCLLRALVANGASAGAHVVIDPFQTTDFHRAALASIRRLGLASMVEFHEELSELALPKMVARKRCFDFVFIDGNHRFDGVFLDAVYANRLLRPGGVMAFDDSWSDPVFLACRFLETNYGYAPVAAYPPMRPGRRRRRVYRGHMRAYRKPDQPQSRGRFHLAPFYAGFEAGDGEERRLRSEGLRALLDGDRRGARQALSAAGRINPRRLNTWLRILRTYLPVSRPRQLERGAEPDRS
ncbi:MAG: O-methyltransferase [Candidatus Binataceae bacterium]